MSDRSRSRSKSGERHKSGERQEAAKSDGSGDEEAEPEEAYEVEEIRDKRRGEDGDYLYYVKWIGWDSDTNTWEPVDHFDDCKEKLTDFERRWEKRQERREDRRREEKKVKMEERRQKELKAAARFSLRQDEEVGGFDYTRKEKSRKPVSESESDSEGEKERKSERKWRFGRLCSREKGEEKGLRR